MNSIKKEEFYEDSRLRKIRDNLDNSRRSLDDTFQFQCDQCGKCCINREDILMSPLDMYNAAKALNLTIPEFFDRYCESYIGPSSRLPLVRLLPRGVFKKCPLLKDKKCTIHTSKPAVCATFPLGRCIEYDVTDRSKPLSTENIQYFFESPNCGTTDVTHTVREWLEISGIPIEDKYFIMWQQVICQLGDIIRKVENVARPDIMLVIWNMTFSILYLGYDTSKEFLPQFARTSKELLRLMEMLPTKKGKNSKQQKA